MCEVKYLPLTVTWQSDKHRKQTTGVFSIETAVHNRCENTLFTNDASMKVLSCNKMPVSRHPFYHSDPAHIVVDAF